MKMYLSTSNIEATYKELKLDGIKPTSKIIKQSRVLHLVLLIPTVMYG